VAKDTTSVSLNRSPYALRSRSIPERSREQDIDDELEEPNVTEPSQNLEVGPSTSNSEISRSPNKHSNVSQTPTHSYNLRRQARMT
jgi:hypothetical protein